MNPCSLQLGSELKGSEGCQKDLTSQDLGKDLTVSVYTFIHINKQVHINTYKSKAKCTYSRS